MAVGRWVAATEATSCYSSSKVVGVDIYKQQLQDPVLRLFCRRGSWACVHLTRS